MFEFIRRNYNQEAQQIVFDHFSYGLIAQSVVAYI